MEFRLLTSHSTQASSETSSSDSTLSTAKINDNQRYLINKNQAKDALGTYWYPFSGASMTVPFASVVLWLLVGGKRPWRSDIAEAKITPPSSPASARTLICSSSNRVVLIPSMKSDEPSSMYNDRRVCPSWNSCC